MEKSTQDFCFNSCSLHVYYITGINMGLKGINGENRFFYNVHAYLPLQLQNQIFLVFHLWLKVNFLA